MAARVVLNKNTISLFNTESNGVSLIIMGHYTKRSSSIAFGNGPHEMHLAVKALAVFHCNVSEEVESFFNLPLIAIRPVSSE